MSEPANSTPELVAQGIDWAKAHSRSRDGPAGDEEDFEQQWKARAVVMAAALAARDYEGADRAEIEAWCRPILQAAATGQDDDIASRTGNQIWSNKSGYRRGRLSPGFIVGAGCARRATRLLALAARQNHPVLHAIGGGLP